MQLTELGNMTPMPANVAKDEDLLGEAHFISLGSSIIGAGRQKIAESLTQWQGGQVAAVAGAW